MVIKVTGEIRKSKTTVETSGNVLDLPHLSNIQDEQFTTLNSSRWLAYDPSNGNQNFGNDQRIGVWHSANVSAGAGASSGATNATSLRLLSQETDAGSGTLPTAGTLASGSAGTRYSYTGGMLDSKSVNTYYPRYGRFEWRAKICHGQGLWSSFWLTAKNGGAGMSEIDLVEYFHAQIPGKNSTTIHGKDNNGVFAPNRYTNNGSAVNNNWGRTFFEAPTYTPTWHIWTFEVLPVTDATGTTLGDPTQPSSYVIVKGYVDGVYQGALIDSSALYWTTNGGTEDSFWNIYLQGCEIDGKYAGHPRSPLGYSHQLDQCLTSGTAPNSCTTTVGGYSILVPVFSGASATIEIDYQRVWKFIG